MTQDQNILEKFNSEKIGWFYQFFVQQSRGAVRNLANI